MVLRYLIESENHDTLREYRRITHPHCTRAFVLDGEIVVADTFDETELDPKPRGVEPPSITEQIKAGQQLRPMGSPSHVTTLADAEIASQFVNRFKALARRPDLPAAEPAASAPAAPAPAPDVEPSK